MDPITVPAGEFSLIRFFDKDIPVGASFTGLMLTRTWPDPAAVPISTLYSNLSIPLTLAFGL